MKRAKTIIIKDPKLRKIRDNLRKILILECVDREEKISARMRKLQINKDGSLRLLTVMEKGEVSKLDVELRKYMFFMRKSICFCRMCHSANKDMSYNLKFKEWYCVDCGGELELSELCECVI